MPTFKMNLRFLLSAGFAGFVLPAASHATTIGFSADPLARTVFQENNLTQVPVGSLVWVGTFGNESFDIGTGITLQSQVAAIQSSGSWSQFTGTSSSLGISNVFGNNRVGGSVVNNSVTANDFNGDNAYLWVFNAPTLSAATQMGIFRSSSPAWTFPTNAGGVGDTVTYGTSDAAVISAIGGIGSVSSGRLVLEAPTPIPEPSTVLYGLLAVGGAAFRRHRQRS